MFKRKRKSKKPTLSEDIRTVRKSGIRTAILVTLLVSGVVPAVSMLFGGQEGVPFSAHLQQMGSVVLHTYPFTVAIAMITLCRQQKWFMFGKWFMAASIILLSASLGNVIGQFTGYGAVQPVQVFEPSSNPIFGIPVVVLNLLAGFYKAYGLRTFLASLFVGIYAGRSASRFLQHIPSDRSGAIELAKDLVDMRRDAA